MPQCGSAERTQYMGINSEVPVRLKVIENFPSGVMHPLAGTARRLSWSSGAGGRIGLVMCQMELGEGETFLECPRLVAQRQVDKLAQKGFKLKSAFEIEFDVMKRDTKEPLTDRRIVPYANLDLMDQHMDMLTDMLNVLRKSRIPVEYFFPEYQAGQFEASMQPQWGVGSAEDAFLFRYGVRSFCHRQALQATFMTRPFQDFHTAGLHFNHSLWTMDGISNVFHDPKDPSHLSATCRHWIAGLLEHAPALMAFCSPTLNCYWRMGVGFAPGVIYWNLDDRLSAFRAKTSGGNVYMENRMPSSAGNPYLIMAATIAAGLDGLERQLSCPSPGRPEKDGRSLPSTLDEALIALEKDEVMRKALGGQTVDYFVTVKRDLEIKHFKDLKTETMSEDDALEKEREYYMELM
ncbi:hypothetical protein ACOMHN_025347 [Nucella lapillus]